MDVTSCIRKRRSVRKFLGKPVEWHKIVEILTSGALAPSSGNLQNWRFIIVRDDSKKEEIASASYDQLWMTDAPIFIVVASITEKINDFYGERGRDIYDLQNCAAAIQNMLLEIHNQGLSTC